MSLLRRRMMMHRIEDYLKGWTFDVSMKYEHPEILLPTVGESVSPYIAIPNGCKRVTCRVSSDSTRKRWYLTKEDGTHRNGQTAPGVGGMVVTDLDKFVRFQTGTNMIDYCWVYDSTNQVFIWKGRKVTEPI